MTAFVLFCVVCLVCRTCDYCRHRLKTTEVRWERVKTGTPDLVCRGCDGGRPSSPSGLAQKR